MNLCNFTPPTSFIDDRKRAKTIAYAILLIITVDKSERDSITKCKCKYPYHYTIKGEVTL